MKKSVLLCLIFLGFVFFTKKDLFFVYAGDAAENQYYCFFASVYSKEKDRCVSIFKENISDLSPKDQKKVVTGKVVYTVNVKKGDTCLSITKNTAKPLSFKECCSLFLDLSGKKSISLKKDPILYIGDRWELVEFESDNGKKLAWNIVKKKK